MEHLAIFHWFSKYNFVCIPVLAFLLDLIIGDPNSKYHPVAIIGRIISFFEAVLYKDTDNDTKKLWYGGIAVGLILVSVYIIAQKPQFVNPQVVCIRLHLGEKAVKPLLPVSS